MQSYLRRSTGVVIACILFMLFALVLPAHAQCGSPPDPRSNSAGYASWCGCMGGSYNYQTTACTGARSSAPSSSSSSSSSGGGWSCRAEARSGAYGYGKDYATEAEARQIALAYCRQNSRGQACSITYCGIGAADLVSRPAGRGPVPRGSYSVAPPTALSGSGGAWGCRAETPGGGAGWVKNAATEEEAKRIAVANCRLYSPGRTCKVKFCALGAGDAVEQPAAVAEKPTPTKPAPQSVRPTGPITAAYDCGECHRKLVADVDKAWASSSTRHYVRLALTDYSACKLKATGACFLGDIFARTLENACTSFKVEKDYRVCLGRTLGR